MVRVKEEKRSIKRFGTVIGDASVRVQGEQKKNHGQVRGGKRHNHRLHLNRKLQVPGTQVRSELCYGNVHLKNTHLRINNINASARCVLGTILFAERETGRRSLLLTQWGFLAAADYTVSGGEIEKHEYAACIRVSI